MEKPKFEDWRKVAPPSGVMYAYRNPAAELHRIVLHHGGGAAVAPGEEVDVLQGYQDHHVRVNGWADIGYHFAVGPDGKLYKGRDVQYVGAHVAGKNTGSIGVVALGNYNVQKPTQPFLLSLHKLLAWLCLEFSILPEAITGHRDHLSTECPGNHLYARLPEVREAVSNIMLTTRTPLSMAPAKGVLSSKPVEVVIDKIVRIDGILVNGRAYVSVKEIADSLGWRTSVETPAGTIFVHITTKPNP